MKTNFALPTTKFSTVVWYRDGKSHEVLMPTPRSNDALRDLMLLKHHVGFSEIKAVKAVEPVQLLGGFGRNFGQ